MRSRFLNTDYFSSRIPIGALSRFQFLPLPTPSDLFPHDPFPDFETPFAGSELDIRIPLEVDRFPIENALSLFLSDVIPKAHSAAEECSYQRVSPRKRRFGSISGEIDDNERAGRSDVEGPEASGALDAGVSDVASMLILEEKDVDECLNLRYNGFVATNSGGNMKELLFELVEVDLPLIKTRNLLGETTLSFEAEEVGIHFEIPDIAIPSDYINNDVEVEVVYPYKIAKSIYLVDEIDSKFDDLEIPSLKTNSSSTHRTVEPKLLLPQFEANENCWDPDVGISDAEACRFLLSLIEPCLGSQVDELVVNANEFLECNSVDIMEDISGESLMDSSPEEKTMSLSSILDMDIVNLHEIMILNRGSAIYATSDGDSSHLPCSVHFQEVQNLDFSSDDVLQIVVTSQPAKTLDMTELMVIDKTELTEGLYQSFISTELALVDDTFKSLPTPFLSDDKAMKSMALIVEELLHSLEPHSLSACDEIYLDWHPLLKGACNREICFSHINMLHDVSTCEIASDLENDYEETASIDIDFFDDFLGSVDMQQSKELPVEYIDFFDDFLGSVDMQQSKELPVEFCGREHATYLSANTETSQLRNNGTLNSENEERNQNIVKEKYSLLYESMSQSNDLNFFLDARRGASVGNYRDHIAKISDKQITPPISLFQGPSLPCEVPKDSSAQWVIDVHTLTLSEHILGVMKHIHKTYLATLEENPYLEKNLLQISNNSETLRISNQKLLELITDKFTKQNVAESCDGDVMTFIALYCLKQLAYFLCFFGVHAARLYIGHLVRSIDKVAERLRSLEALLEDVCWKCDKQLVESHPSLSLIECLLKSSIQDCEKILIIAETVFWLPLTKKLASMGIKLPPEMVDHVPPSNLDKIDSTTYETSLLEGLKCSDCLLLSYENVSPSFPFNNFGIIVEYGGPHASSRLSSVSPKSYGFPRVHFIHVELESHLAAIAISEGPDACKHPAPTKEVATLEFMPSMHKSLSNIIEILNFVPAEKNKICLPSGYVNQMESSYENEFVSRLKNVDSREPCFPDVVVVVNTQNFEKKMLISRRTSYQKIFALEKMGVQVVERDVDLPLDLIFNAAVCLIWYEARNFMDQKATRIEDITIYVENIATSILMSLSYSFSTCILIFEGESSFLSAIMESSDSLYAAAASLDMNLQLFCSYESDSTDDIILSCIKAAARSTKSLYPAMPESESIGESFLTRFPSINPLSAHAIISSSGSLVEFLEWSNEHRIQAVGKYHVPKESVSLFSALCKYGEVGECKSAMTECSSIDSDINSGLLASPRKRQRHASRILPMPANDPFLSEPMNQNIRATEKLPIFQQYQLRNFSNIQEKMRTIDGSYYNDMPGKRPCRSTVSGHGVNHLVEPNCMNNGFIDEINDHDCIVLDEKPFASDTFNFLELRESVSEPAIRSSHATTSRQAFSRKDHSVFLLSKDINRARNNNFLKDHYLSFSDGILKPDNIHSNNDDGLVIDQDHCNQDFMQDHRTNIFASSAQGNVPPAYSGNPFSSTTQPSRLQGHGWFTDILQRLKEKSNNKGQQSIPRNPCFNCTRTSNFKDTPSKSQSPSIFDTFRYQGSNQSKNTTQRKRKKDVQGKLSLSTKDGKDSSFITRTWTPIDKRARQNLSFARNGNEKQSKLVWRSSNSPSTDSSIRKRYRDDR